MDSLSELRKRVQAPVRRYNDVAGILVGDRVSIHVTRVFVACKLSPTVATLSFLFFGLFGSILLLFGGWIAAAGFGCLFLYYIFDCVDGEVARYYGREKLIWGFHDFMFHLYVKSAFFVCLGIYAVRATGEPWVFLFALSGLLASLFTKFLYDVSLILTCRYVLLRSKVEREHYVSQIAPAARSAGGGGDADADPEPQHFRGVLPLLRTAATNFDLAILLFFAAAVADVFLAPIPLFGLVADAKILLVILYGVLLPLDFLDRLRSHLRSNSFFVDARELLQRAHDFQLWR